MAAARTGGRPTRLSTLSDLLAEHTKLSGGEVDHLQMVVAEWQLLSDLSFADVLMWVPIGEPPTPGSTDVEFLCVAQARATTAPTAHPEDVVSSTIAAADHPQLRRAMAEQRICREEDPRWYQGVPVRREAIPVTFDDRVIAVLSRETDLAVPRVPSSLEIAYLGIAADLCQMVADGSFPTSEPAADVHTSPRVGDGLVRLDNTGTVVFASPNAQSAYHRMGHAAELVGVRLAPLTRGLIADPFDATEIAQRILAALDGQPSMRAEAEAHRGAAVLFRALPLRPSGTAAGALVLVRDVTEVRRRDRALLSKDATIREIHHRVKNNLQTVAALLRMQARRIESPEARVALTDAMSRVASIAIVHETLSQAFDEIVEFDQVADELLRMVGDVAASWGGVSAIRQGSFGLLPADVATSLAMIISELCQNAVEHGLAHQSGEVRVVPSRFDGRLRMEISDDGRGLPPDFNWRQSRSLGLSIVNTLVAEMEGSFQLGPRQAGSGTRAVVEIPL